MNKVKKFREIDSEKLRDSLSRRGMTLAGASRSIGLSDGAISMWVKYGKIPSYAIILLERGLDIPFSEYEGGTESPKEACENGDSCFWCKDSDCAFPIDVSEGKFSAFVVVLGNKRRMELNVSYGKETVIEGSADIKFCPFCGREL